MAQNGRVRSHRYRMAFGLHRPRCKFSIGISFLLNTAQAFRVSCFTIKVHNTLGGAWDNVIRIGH